MLSAALLSRAFLISFAKASALRIAFALPHLAGVGPVLWAVP